MKKRLFPRSAPTALRRPAAEKAELDLQTTYLTLLPHMDEGFHIGYQPRPGIVNDTNQKPHEWLENMAKYMQTQGEDVGYSIPDVLAGEQQMRRLIRLPHEEAIRHQEMVNWRATLAVLLLWDAWEKDETWPEMSFEDYLTEESMRGAMAFQKTVSAALTRERVADGLKVFALTKFVDQKPEKRPFCMVSRSVIVMPAANPGDLSHLLPPQIRWYDRKRKRFLDPCPFLEESDRARLTLQLRLLQCMNEQKEMGSYLYAPEASLCSPLERFIDDLQNFRSAWRDKLARRDEEAVREFYVRTLAVYGLRGGATQVKIDGLTEEWQQLDCSALWQNPLIRQLMPEGAGVPGVIDDVQQTQYLLSGVPFAKASANWLLEPTNHAAEKDALSRLGQEEALLCEYSGQWNADMARCFGALYDQMKQRVGVHPVVLSLLKEWQRKHAAYPAQRDANLTLYFPVEGHPQTLGLLMDDLIGASDVKGICGAFSDCLLVMVCNDRPPFQNPELNAVCRVQGPGKVVEYAVPPLSPWLAGWLMDQSERDDAYAPRLKVDSLSFQREEGDAIRASFRIVCKKPGDDALLTNTVTFSRTYRGKDCAGGVVTAAADEMPFVLAWPNTRLSRGLWKQYFVYTHRPEALETWVRQGEGWGQGAVRQALDTGEGSQTKLRAWQTAVSDRYPAYVALKRGPLSMGALVNDAVREQLKHEPAAVVSIDFGSIATTVMLRQGDKVQPATFPKCLHGALLHTREGDENFLTDELLPMDALLPNAENLSQNERESTFYSVMDMFTDEHQKWRGVLRDGHIYYRGTLDDLMRKNESALYYDMKWGEEPYILHCMRLFLKQVMVQASLSARLCGAPSLSWRISMPSAMPLPRQEAYLEMMRGLSLEVAVETGMLLTADIPNVLYATENQADGLYFRSRNEVNVRSGYINMDIGGGTTDISLWLNNAQRATLETSLMLGCRQMLFDSVSARHLDAFQQDFEQSGDRMKAVVKAVTQTLSASLVSTRGRQKSMFLLDDFFADYDRDIWKMMAQVRSDGRISYVESLLLLNIGFLFHLCGELVNRSWQDDKARGHLHPRMEICIAGNGGQLLKAFDNETRAKLCRMALQALGQGHPVRELMLVQSRHPKQEVAIGLLSDEQRMRSAIHGEDGFRESPQPFGDHGYHGQMMRSFLVRFASAFPQAAERLMPDVFDKAQSKGIALAPSAAMELDTILDNEFYAGSEDDFVTYARCFGAMKRLWRV